MISIEVAGIVYRFVDHLFAVSHCGKVLRKLHPYKPNPRKDGYLALGRSNNLMHRAVAQCWLDTFDPINQVHHINGDKADNRADNLECLTPKEHFGDRHAGLYGRYVRTDETIEKIRQARLGSVTSEETKAKQRAALLGRKRPYFSRAAHSDESKQARSLDHPRNTGCSVFDIEYRSFAEAAKATNIHRFTIRKRCLSENFPDFKIL
jgi:hypothetical protein